MRIVVTGAAGFVGSVLCKRAAEEGWEVLALDDHSRGLNAVWTVPGVVFKAHDCRQGVREALDGFRPDAILHMAAGTGSLDRPIEELRDLNLRMTQAVFADALEMGVRAFAYPTTSLALGVPDSPYVVSKEETMAWLLAHARQDCLLPLRFFNVLGAYKGFTESRKAEVHILPRLVQAYLRGDPFVVNGTDYRQGGDGTPARDFVHVLDVADYLLHLVAGMARGSRPVPAVDGAVWVGTGRETTVLQVVRTFEKFFDKLQVEFGPRRPYDVGGLRCATDQVAQLTRFRLPAPAWVGIRDEVEELLSRGR